MILLQASSLVEGVDRAFLVIFGISIFFLVAISIVMVYFVIRYRRKKNPKATQIEGSNTLEIVWTVIPTILVLIMFYYGWVGFLPMRECSDSELTVKATAWMWDWEFEHETGTRSRELYVPVDKKLKLEMTSRDVIHSLFIPAFRAKEDMVPGGETNICFTPTDTGTFDILCAEYCGLRHSYMVTKIHVLPQKEFDHWLATAPSQVPASEEHPGLTVMKKNACIGCHTLDGTKLVGPSFKGMFGATRAVIIDGEEFKKVADEEAMKIGIYKPNQEVVKGYGAGMMRTYEGLVSDEEADQIIDYLETIKE